MESGNRRKITLLEIIAGLGVIIQTVLVFVLEVRYSFMLEDVDYLCNLSTGGELTGLKDIFQGLGSVYRETGGSLLSIFVLQLILLLGNNFANVVNTLAILLVAFLIIKLARIKRTPHLFFALSLFMLIVMNSDWQYSYMWEFGTVNYFFPAIPFLLFMIILSGELVEGADSASNAAAAAAILTAFAAGWANAAYGIIEVCTGIIAVLLLKKMLKVKPPVWIYISIASSAIGSLLYLISPGNYTDKSIMTGSYLSFSIFPAVILTLVMLAMEFKCGGWLSMEQLLLTGVLGCTIILFFLLDWIPVFSDNGIRICVLTVAIALFIGLFSNILRERPKQKYWGYILAGVFLIYSVMTMLEEYAGVS